MFAPDTRSMQNNPFASSLLYATAESPSPSAPRRKFPRRNACTHFTLMKSAVLAASDSNSEAFFGNMACPTPPIPVVSDASLMKDKTCTYSSNERLRFDQSSLNRHTSSLKKRFFENHDLESVYDGNCNLSDLHLTAAEMLECQLGGISPRRPKKRPCQ
jgi:hypothetical protein